MNQTKRSIDDTLRSYFRAQMPDPWPAPPREPIQPQATSGLRLTRWAVAASVALLLAGYLALAGVFPRPTTHFDDDPQRHIGSRPTSADTQKSKSTPSLPSP